MRVLIAVLLLASAGAVQAAPVTWYLDDVYLDDGASVTGSFDYDAATNTFSSVSIVVADRQLGSVGYWVGPVLSADPFIYEVDGPENSSGIGFGFSLYEIWNDDDPYADICPIGNPAICGRRFVFDFEASLTSGASTIALDPFGSNEFVGNQFYYTVDISNVVSGAVTLVPIPAAAWLFGSALVGLGCVRRGELRCLYSR